MADTMRGLKRTHYCGEVSVQDIGKEVLVGGFTQKQRDKGELVFIDLPDEGTRVEAGDEVLELESAKAVEPLVCPVAGTIRYVNHDAADDPSVVNNDPYGEGWLLKIELDDDEPELLDAESYAKIAQ